jgi:hypothetical protein
MNSHILAAMDWWRVPSSWTKELKPPQGRGFVSEWGSSTMARVRKIKPGYNDSDAIARLSYPARLLDVCLWGYLDGNGIIENSASSIKAKVFPRDDIKSSQVTELLLELIRGGRLFSLEVDGKNWLYRKDFRKEQRIYPDELRKCQVSREVLDSYDNAHSLPQAQVLECGSQPQLFSTSSSTQTSTSSSPSVLSTNLKTENGDNFKSLDRVDPPSGFFEKLFQKLKSQPQEVRS